MSGFVTRIAPSPTGDLHCGTARTAYFNWLAARCTGGQFILRIDDTDPERSNDKFINPIFESLKWLGLTWDRLEYQSQRLSRYISVAEKLVHEGKAEHRDNAIFLTDIQLPKIWHDEVSGDIAISARDVEILKQGIVLVGSTNHDGGWVLDRPIYHFASCVDDADMGVNFVIRGVDHTTNTARQIAIWNAIGAVLPKFAHVGMIQMGGKKLSKRDGAASMLAYMEQGYDPDAILNTLARMGWGPTIDDKTTSMLPKERMLELFLSGGKMKASAANLDMQKLASFDRKYKSRKKQGVANVQ